MERGSTMSNLSGKELGELCGTLCTFRTICFHNFATKALGLELFWDPFKVRFNYILHCVKKTDRVSFRLKEKFTF